MKEFTAPPPPPPVEDEDDEASRGAKRKKTLLERYEIPIEHLDFRYLEKCQDAKEVERIVKVLRSGEEGHFPDLEKFAAKRLETVNPKSRLLRVEVPILRSEHLNKDELTELKRSFLDWVDKIEGENELEALDSSDPMEIFNDNIPSLRNVPIRSVEKTGEETSSGTDLLRKPNPDRIKSWEYDKWDKFDVDAELTKLDVESMQVEEWERSVDKKKLKEEQELVAKLMKNEDLKERKAKSVFSTTKALAASSPKKVPAAIAEVVVPKTDVPELEDVDSDEAPSTSGRKKFEKLEVGADNESLSKKLVEELQTMTQPTKPPAVAKGKNNSRPAMRHTASEFQAAGTSLGRSFIEELPDDNVKVPTPPKPKSRFRIHIEDLNVS